MPLGVDIGGTSVRAACVSSAGEILHSLKAPLPPNGDPDSLAELLKRLVAPAREAAAQTDTSADQSRIGVALPGRLSADRRRLERALHLPALEGVDIVSLLQNAIGLTPRLIPDASAAAFAQWRATVPDARRFVYLTIGTGVGGCAILDGALCDFPSGHVAHYGHLCVNTESSAPRCVCGASGCLEACVTGAAITTGFTPEAARRLALGLQQLTHLWAPDAVCLGGGVLDHHPAAFSRTREIFDALPGRLVPRPRLWRGALSSDDAGVTGAALLAAESEGL